MTDTLTAATRPKTAETRPGPANRTIFTGDNLDVLRGLDSDLADLIYLDPPFNSNQTYSAPVGSKAAGAAFKDTWTLSDLDVAEVGLLADTEPALAEYIRSVRLVHGDSMMSYLTMMAVRLVEMRRVLKPAGSIYLHCDDAADAYLKVLMDSIFGKAAFRNAITWQRSMPHNDAKRYGRVSDRILYYAGPGARWNPVFVMPSEEVLRKRYSNADERGRYTTAPLHARGLSGGGYDYTWQGVTDTWRMPMERLDELDRAGLVHWPKNGGGVPRRKMYADDYKGNAPSDVIVDIKVQRSEKLGYPTQKPVKLLERIIEASSNPGDLVLDPFAGCATTCDAAEGLGREWVGIDLSDKAAELMEHRLRDRHGLFGQVIHRTDLPRRGDLEPVPHYRTNARTLYGRQEGDCAGCGHHFGFRNLEVDHIVPQSKGGSDHLENLQLLCGACNRVKGRRSMAYLVAALGKAKRR